MNNTFETTVKQVTEKFLNSDAMRSYTSGGKRYVAEFVEEHDLYDNGEQYHILDHVDFGADYSEIAIPQTYTQLVNAHMRAQLNMSDCMINELAQRYYYEIMRELND